ncbi:33K [Ovine adenovirus 8]|uniref:33K n=1 Tax=Ovine adenovirus 8 TaxID=2601527 RepID=A0A5B8MDS7_9ADEN|nr:33K [Ovine adenovirus 8]QDZ17472.1 33K [Ovine adenovirus 8]
MRTVPPASEPAAEAAAAASATLPPVATDAAPPTVTSTTATGGPRPAKRARRIATVPLPRAPRSMAISPEDLSDVEEEEDLGLSLSEEEDEEEEDEEEEDEDEKLRELIFPTLYAIFQQTRAQRCHLKVKNRSLRSLTRSCLYHNREDQLQRTLTDAETLLSKYCAAPAPPADTERDFNAAAPAPVGSAPAHAQQQQTP